MKNQRVIAKRNRRASLILITAAFAFSASANLGHGQGTSSSSAAAKPAARPDVYHVNFSHAAMGKAAALQDAYKKAAASETSPGHGLLLRHEDGASWDYAAIQHLGTRATVEATGNPAGATFRSLMDWHDDTFVNGPAWADFAKAMDLDESGKSKSNGNVYVVSVYRPVVGQDDALEKFLSEPPAASNDLAAGVALFQHLEGSAWRFMAITRYKSWQDYATSEANSVSQTSKGSGGWYQLRDLVSFHTDTITSRVAP